MGIIFNTRVARGACCGRKFRRGVGRVSQMSVGILLYTRVVGEFIMSWVAITRVLKLMPMRRGVMGCGVLWRALGVNLAMR